MIRGMPFLLIGIEPLTLPRGVQYGGLAGDKDFGAFSAPPGQTIAAPETLRDIGAAAGASVTDRWGKALPPIRSSGGTPPGLLVVDIGMAQALLDRPGQLSRLILQQQPDVETPPLATVAGGALRLRPPGEEEADLRRLTESFHLNLTAFGLLCMSRRTFHRSRGFGLAFEQRLAMVRTMRAVGVSSCALVAAMLCELALLALAAGSAGVAAGYGLASALLPNVAASLDALYGGTGGGTADARWEMAAVGSRHRPPRRARRGGGRPLESASPACSVRLSTLRSGGKRSNASCGAGRFLRCLPLPRRWRRIFGAKASIRVSR